MNERPEYYISKHNGLSGHDTLPPINKTMTVQTLAGNIEAAHENGGLFILAAHLRSLLEEFYEKNGPTTAAELETLLVWAARAMRGD